MDRISVIGVKVHMKGTGDICFASAIIAKSCLFQKVLQRAKKYQTWGEPYKPQNANMLRNNSDMWGVILTYRIFADRR